MPTMPLNVTRHAKHFSEQRWLLDAVINLMGPEWDQNRITYMISPCSALWETADDLIEANKSYPHNDASMPGVRAHPGIYQPFITIERPNN